MAEYKDMACRDYRARLLGDVDKLLYPQPSYAVSERVDYIGPFYFECDDMNAENIVATEMEMIRKCSDAIFILDDANAPGTIAELVYAASLQKNLHIFYVRLSDSEETESCLHTPNWYPIFLCRRLTGNIELIECSSKADAESKAINRARAL